MGSFAWPPSLVEVLAAHMAAMGLTAADSDRLFFEAPSGGLLSYPELTQGGYGFLRLRRAECEGAGFHDLRRANPTQLVAGGTDPKSVQPVSATATSAESSASILRPGRADTRTVCTLTGTYRLGYILGVDAVLHALSDESRRTVLEVLREHPATVGELASLLPIARPGVSRHLRVLREAGLVEVRQEAQQRVYNLRPEALAELDAWLGRYRVLWEERLDALHTEVARGKRARRERQ